MMPPPAPLPPPDDDPWDEFDTAPAPVVAPPMPGPPAQAGGAVAPGLPMPPVAGAMPTPAPAEGVVPATEPVAQAVVQPVPAAAVQPMMTNLGGQQVMMQAGMVPVQGATVVQVPVPVAKEPREWPPLTHMIVMAGFGLLLFTALLVLFANLADPPSELDYPLDDDATFEDLQQASDDLAQDQDKYDRRQAVYGAFSLFFATVGQLAVVAGLLLYTVKDAEGMPAPVRAVLFGGVLLFLIRMLTNGLDLAALL
ncbi:MAG TPA: hypothetical protein D7I05_04620 [Candidatus Poseidoniales archaeon]|nr:MAG TPA: hypothetical protein D7I05_04620 [Candidatus Poseidoniales archaeon]